MSTKLQRQRQLVDLQWDRYTSGMDRGHVTYQETAQKNEEFYIGGGLQWDQDIREALELQGKPWLEENIIFPTVNTVLGYQTQSRMDIAYKPRGRGDQDISDLLSKISMFIVDQNRYPWIESQVFADGLIQQRGYFDIRMEFDKNINGDVSITQLDPLDVIPDPDAKSYNPDDWQDVTITKWLTLDDIKVIYGNAAYRKVAKQVQGAGDSDWGSAEYGVERNKFSDAGTYYSHYVDKSDVVHVQVLERQWYKLINREFFYDLETGDLLPVPDDIPIKEKKAIAKQNEYELIKRPTKRIRWTVTTKDCLLHDAWSPYDFFTVVPFFPYFRRGKTVGLVDNLVKTQEMLNKVYSQILHVVNTTANSGWIVQEDSLSNMETEDLEDIGADSGIVLEVRPGREAPVKIEPNQIPTGLKDLVNTGVELIRVISGVSETFQGGKGPEVSGTAIQSRVHQSAIQLATPIDNLFRTRNMIAERILKLIQQFYTEERTYLITQDESRSQDKEEITINEMALTGEIINDVTVGKYDVVIADVPTQITFQNAQFQQALDMRKFGVQIPDDEMIKMSTLTRKNEIAKRMSGELSEEQQQIQQQQLDQQLRQMEETIAKLEAESESKQLESTKKAAEIAQMIIENPAIGPMLDQILSKEDEREQAEQASEGQEQQGPSAPQQPQEMPVEGERGALMAQLGQLGGMPGTF